MTQDLKSSNGSAIRMVEPGETRRITRSIEWKLNLADLIMQVDQLPEDALRMFVKMQYSKMHEGAAAEGFQQINVEEAINQYGGDPREALKKYFKCWFLLNIPLEGGNMASVPTDAPPIVQRVWKNLEALLLHPFDDEVRMAQEVQKRTEAFETAAHEYRIRLDATLKTLKDLKGPKSEWAVKLQTAYINVERAAKDIEELAAKYDVEKSGRGQVEKRIEVYEKQITGIREESARLLKEKDAKLKKVEDGYKEKDEMLDVLSAEVDSTKAINDDLGKKVVELEAELAKEKAASAIYLEQSVKSGKAYYDKENERLQAHEIAKAELGKADAERKKATKLENKLNNINKKWRIRVAGVGAALLAAGLYFYRPSDQVAPVENVPQEIVNYAKDKITIKFGNALYEMNADRFSEIYQQIERDQKTTGKQFTPADRKQYFEKKTESVRQIK